MSNQLICAFIGWGFVAVMIVVHIFYTEWKRRQIARREKDSLILTLTSNNKEK